MKETSLHCPRRIENKIKSVLKIMKQPIRAVPQQTDVYKVNNRISKILEKHAQTRPLSEYQTLQI